MKRKKQQAMKMDENFGIFNLRDHFSVLKLRRKCNMAVQPLGRETADYIPVLKPFTEAMSETKQKIVIYR